MTTTNAPTRLRRCHQVAQRIGHMLELRTGVAVEGGLLLCQRTRAGRQKPLDALFCLPASRRR